MKKTDAPIIIKEDFDCNRKTLWEAITDLKYMKHWYFDQIEKFEAEVGFKTQFVVTVEDRTYTHMWEIIEVTPFQKITYTWQFQEHPGISTSAFEVIENKNGVSLVLTIEVLENFPDNIPEFRRESCIAGWEYFINGNLKNYMASR